MPDSTPSTQRGAQPWLTPRHVVLALFTAGVFLSYPLALAIPVRLGVPLTFDISLPVRLWASVAAVAFVVTLRLRGSQPCSSLWRGGVLVGTLLCLISAGLSPRLDLGATFELAGFLAIPGAVAVLPRRWLPRSARWFGVFWLVNVLHGFWQWSRGFPVVGVCGNQNWLAPVLLALAPFAWRALPGRTERTRIASAAAVAAVALLLTWQTQSRAAVVALGGYAVWWLFRRLGVRGRIALGSGLVALVLAGGALGGRARIERLVEADIRPPCWRDTLRLVAGNPLLGVGPGNFRREFASLRGHEYLRRETAADITEHPHNELLRVAAEGGIPVALLWAIAIGVPALCGVRKREDRAVQFALFVLLVHGMFDKVLVQPPSAFLALWFAGVRWRTRLPVRLDCRRAVVCGWCHWFSRAGVLLLGLWTLQASVRDIGADAWMRHGMLREHNGDGSGAYEAFAAATRHAPDRARAALFAGRTARVHLRSPQTALMHLAAARELEPDYGHLNLELGLALGAVGRHDEAHAFFAREVNRFPFDPGPLQFLFNASVHTAQFRGLNSIWQHIGDLRYVRVYASYGGEERTRGGVRRFLEAMQQQRWDEAALLADALIAPLQQGRRKDRGIGSVEPLFPGVTVRGAPDFRLPPRFRPIDMRFWAGGERLRAIRAFDTGGALVFNVREFSCRHQALWQVVERSTGVPESFVVCRSPSLRAVAWARGQRGAPTGPVFDFLPDEAILANPPDSPAGDPEVENP